MRAWRAIGCGSTRSIPRDPMFEFTLDAIDAIQPWGEPGKLSLSWFALSLGEYHLELGGREVLRYSDAAVEYFKRVAPRARAGPFVEYQVARLHEDLLQIIPQVLQRVPDD